MGAYVDVAGVPTYYERHGSGEPLVLLHGGGGSVESWGAQIPALAEEFEVWVPERRGHGRTRDTDAPFSYPAMAEETVGFLEAVGLSSAHLVGWSDGALVGVLTALARPDLVRRLVVIGQWYTEDGMRPEAREMLEQKDLFAAFLREPYASVSPDGPEHFPVVLEKWLTMWHQDPGVGPDRLADLAAPTLVMQGDDDLVTVQHSAAVVAAVPDAQLAVVPGTSHGLPLERPELVNRMIADFLAGKQPEKLFSFSAPH